MHAQTISTTTNTEATPARAAAAMLLAAGNKPQRRKLDYQFPQACTPEAHQAWKGMAKDVKKLHDAVSNGRTKVGDDPGVVGEAYRKACRAGHRDSGVSAQMAAHVAIETIAKSFVIDGTYARMAINPTGISYVAGLVGELQNRSRGLNLQVGLGGLAVSEVFFKKDDRSAWDAAVANRAHQRKIDEDGDGSEEWSDAERAFYTTPAPDFGAVLQKLGDNIQAEDVDCGMVENTETVDQTVARLANSHDLNETCLAHVYLDIQRLAGVAPPITGVLADPAADDAALITAVDEVAALDAALMATDDMEEAHRCSEAKQAPIDFALATRATSLAGLQARVRLVELWAPKADTLDGQDLEWMIVRSLLDDIKALSAVPARDDFSPLSALVHERRRLIAEVNAEVNAGEDDLPMSDPRLVRMGEIQDEFEAAPCTSFADARAMIDMVCQLDGEGLVLNAELLQEIFVKIGRVTSQRRQQTPIGLLAAELHERCSLEADLSDAPGLDDDQREALVSYAGAVAHRVMSTPAQTLEDFRVKARAVAWATNEDWDGWDVQGTREAFAKSIVRELLGTPPHATDAGKLEELEEKSVQALASIYREQPPHAIAAE